MMKELALDKDIVDMMRARRLSYLGHVVGTSKQRYPHLLYGRIQSNLPKGRWKKKKWTMSR